MKEVTFDPIQKMLKGFNRAAEAVIATLGPKGRNVFIDDVYAPKIINDGAMIANQMVFKDKVENAGAYFVRNTSGQTNDDAGDGTTTTVALLYSILHEAIKRPENPMEVRASLKAALPEVLAKLKSQAKEIEMKDIKKVALISAEDEKIASIVTEIVQKIGKDAVITVEDSKTFETSYELVEGYEAHVGFISPSFITDHKTAKATHENVAVVVSERRIGTVADIAPLFELFKKQSINSAVFVAEDVDNSILGVLAANKAMGNFNSLLIKATGPLLMDIEAAVGATRISEVTGVSFQNFEQKHLGFAKKVVADASKTIFLGDGTKAKDFANHLEASAEHELNMFAKEKLLDRVAKLRGGVAVIRVGAHSDFEREYLKPKAEDTIKAVKAALEEGVVEGGGIALWRIAQGLKPNTIGKAILKTALTFPLRKIVSNAGKEYAEVALRVNKTKGYNARDDKYENMFDAGIIDPAKVERCALENAVSAASIFITTEVTVTDYEESKSTK